jgi:hypothetical protein
MERVLFERIKTCCCSRCTLVAFAFNQVQVHFYFCHEEWIFFATVASTTATWRSPMAPAAPLPHRFPPPIAPPSPYTLLWQPRPLTRAPPSVVALHRSPHRWALCRSPPSSTTGSRRRPHYRVASADHLMEKEWWDKRWGWMGHYMAAHLMAHSFFFFILDLICCKNLVKMNRLKKWLG